MRHLPAMMVRNSFALFAFSTALCAQSITEPFDDAVAIEQIEPLAETPLDRRTCQEQTDIPCDPQDTVLLQGKTPDADAKVIVREDGAYLRLGKSKSNETTEDTVLDLNPLAPSD